MKDNIKDFAPVALAYAVLTFGVIALAASTPNFVAVLKAAL